MTTEVMTPVSKANIGGPQSEVHLEVKRGPALLETRVVTASGLGPGTYTRWINLQVPHLLRIQLDSGDYQALPNDGAGTGESIHKHIN